MASLFFELGVVLEGGVLEGGCTLTPYGMTTSFRWELPNPPNAQKVPAWNFCNFPRNHASAAPHVRSVGKCPRPTFRNFLSSCLVLLQQRLRIIFTFRTVSAELSAKFLQDFPHKVSSGLYKVSAVLCAGFPPDVRRQLLPKSLRTRCLGWVSRKESAMRTQYLELTYAETGPTNRWRTDAHNQSLVRKVQNWKVLEQVVWSKMFVFQFPPPLSRKI